jgi:hypothetical protein
MKRRQRSIVACPSERSRAPRPRPAAVPARELGGFCEAAEIEPPGRGQREASWPASAMRTQATARGVVACVGDADADANGVSDLSCWVSERRLALLGLRRQRPRLQRPGGPRPGAARRDQRPPRVPPPEQCGLAGIARSMFKPGGRGVADPSTYPAPQAPLFSLQSRPYFP